MSSSSGLTPPPPVLGDLAAHLPDYEPRAGQARMAEVVERALREERIVLCEAGTGVGKTFAYLAPAILSGKKVVISTATRALQEQVFVKDLPVIEAMLGVSARAVMMKGLGNYLCRRRFGEFRRSADAERAPLARSLRTLELWVDQTSSGDVAELTRIREDDPVWHEVTASSDTRLGARCPHFRECFVTELRQAAEAARLIIVNHHLFFADLSLRGPHPGRVLPDYDAVIFDEAHQLEDIATQFLGVRVSRTRSERLLGDLERAFAPFALTGLGKLRAHGQPHFFELGNASERFWHEVSEKIPGNEGRVTLDRGAFQGELAAAWHRLDAALEAAQAEAERAEPSSSLNEASLGVRRAVDAEVLEQLARRTDSLRRDLALAVEGERGFVSYLDVNARSMSLAAAPVDVSATVKARVFERVPAVVLTSATLTSVSGGSSREAPASDFNYIRERLGLTSELDVIELKVESPFVFAEQALLYTPLDLPPPDAPDFMARAAARTVELIEVTAGGAFILTTSLRAMHALHSLLVAALPGRSLYLQGQAPKHALIRAFQSAGDAVLVATQSFWEGVDVPGDALRLVVLEKVPFVSPADPVVRARSEALEAEGQNAFMQLHVPLAAISLKQGFGRLIRHRNDRGIVALFDSRIHRRGYGKRLLASLPPAARTTELEKVREFWESAKAKRRVEPAFGSPARRLPG